MSIDSKLPAAEAQVIPEPQIVVVPMPRAVKITTEGTMNEDSAALYISWITQTDLSPRTLGDWRNRHVGPNYFQPSGTKIVTYQKDLVDLWFYGSKQELDQAA